MLFVNGYYDGQEFVLIEKVTLKKNQKVIITLLDDFLEPQKTKNFQKFVDKLDQESYDEIVEALKGCEQAAVN